MAFDQVMIVSGPLPMTGTFTSPTDGPTDFYVTGTVQTSSANAMVGINVSLNGTVIGSVNMWINPAMQHAALPPLFCTGNVTSESPQTLTISAFSDATHADTNDVFVVNVRY